MLSSSTSSLQGFKSKWILFTLTWFLLSELPILTPSGQQKVIMTAEHHPGPLPILGSLQKRTETTICTISTDPLSYHSAMRCSSSCFKGKDMGIKEHTTYSQADNTILR